MPVNKANRLQIASKHKAMFKNETGNKMMTPVKKEEVVHLVHKAGG